MGLENAKKQEENNESRSEVNCGRIFRAKYLVFKLNKIIIGKRYFVYLKYIDVIKYAYIYRLRIFSNK